MHLQRLFSLTSICLLMVACGTKRTVISPEEWAQRDRAVSERQMHLRRTGLQMLLERMELDHKAGRPIRLDFLYLSGGGSFGAFGAAFMHAWRTQVADDHELAFPDFDLVSGVSTGALLTPFAAVGTPERLAQAEAIYRDCNPTWVTFSKWSILGGGSGLADTSGLDAVLRKNLDLKLAAELAALQNKHHKQAVVGSSDLDLGRPVSWRLGDEAGRAIAVSDSEFLFRPLRASASIPGAFSPIYVDGNLHVDGAVFGQIHVLTDARIAKWLVETWRQRHPKAALPSIRYFIIINNITRPAPVTVQPNWTAIMMRANMAMMKEQVTGPLNQLAVYSRMLHAEFGLDVQMRWVAIPPDFDIPKVDNEFDPVLTGALADLGAKMGADPAIWNDEDDLGLNELERATLKQE